MAYLDTERKVIILYTHKTGTNTLRHILRDHGRIDHVRLEGINNHPSLDQIRYQYPEIGEQAYEYEVYAFYRNPIERHLSWMKYVSNSTYREPNLTMMQWYDKYGFFVPQVRWIRHSTVNINLLNYHDFDAEVRRVMGRIGIHIPLTETFQKHNASGNTRTEADLTPEEVSFLKDDILKEDYDYLASRGITFNV